MVAEINPRGNTFRVVPPGLLADAGRTIAVFAHVLCQESALDGTGDSASELVFGGAALQGFAPAVPLVGCRVRPEGTGFGWGSRWQIVDYPLGGAAPEVVISQSNFSWQLSLWWRLVLRGDGGGGTDYVAWVSQDGISWEPCMGVASTIAAVVERFGLSGRWVNRSLLDWLRVYDMGITASPLQDPSILKPLTGGRLFVP